MSLFSTLAHGGAVPAKRFSLKGIGMGAVGIALGITVGSVIANHRTADLPEQTAAAAIGLAHDDFLRLNTSDLPKLSPVAPDAIEPQPVVDLFMHINTTAYDGLVPAAPSAAIGVRGAVDPNFLYWNTTAFDNVVPAAVSKPQNLGNATAEFLHWNITSLEYPSARYSEQPNGPR